MRFAVDGSILECVTCAELLRTNRDIPALAGVCCLVHFAGDADVHVVALVHVHNPQCHNPRVEDPIALHHPMVSTVNALEEARGGAVVPSTGVDYLWIASRGHGISKGTCLALALEVITDAPRSDLGPIADWSVLGPWGRRRRCWCLLDRLARDLAGRGHNRVVCLFEPTAALAQRVETAAFGPPAGAGAGCAASVDGGGGD